MSDATNVLCTNRFSGNSSPIYPLQRCSGPFFFLCFVDTFFFFIKLEWLSWKFPVDAHRVLQLAKKLGYLKFCTVVIKLCLGSPAFNH